MFRREGRPFEFLLGLPALRPGALWSQAIALNAPTLISANALSRWHVDGRGLRNWDGFDGRHLGLVSHHKVALDSGGFIAASHYRGFPWSTRDYLDLAAAAPWLWWAAQEASAAVSPIASSPYYKAGIHITISAAWTGCPGRSTSHS
jgi:hypothetical protein